MFGGVLNQAQNSALPVGSIIMWYNTPSHIPEGWHVCDGTNGTPDLRGKFVLGSDDNGKYPFDSQGGEEQHTLTVGEMPSHGHSSGSLKASNAGEHTHTIVYCDETDSYFPPTSDCYALHGNNKRGTWTGKNINSSGSHTHTISGSTGLTGSSQPHNNMPPYYAIYYIMKIA